MKRFLLLLTLAFPLVYGVAHAQAAPWDTNQISWALPTTCTTGEAIAACPLTGIRLEESATVTGTYRTVATLAATSTTYTHVGVSAGPHCYRAFALSAIGDSVASNVQCKTNVKPVGPPNPPVLTVVDASAYVPVKRAWGYAMADQIGTARIGAECDETQSFGGGFYALKHPKTDVAYYIGRKARAVVASRCA